MGDLFDGHSGFEDVYRCGGDFAGVLGDSGDPDDAAGVGVSDDLDEAGVSTTDPGPADGITVVTRRHDHVDRAVAEADTAGFARLALDARGRVVGATVVGPRAGETLAELTLAVRMGLRTRDLASTIHAYPTYADGPWNAAIDDVHERLGRGPTARATTVLLRLRRARTN